ncbi:unnamed protein product [Amoebophrya sp. A25]|nr:unnamed protein product [Amoebophrya sp. A25]|eukprot:GSA25T00025619001.1
MFNLDVFNEAKKRYLVANHQVSELNFACPSEQMLQLLASVEKDGKKLHKSLLGHMKKILAVATQNADGKLSAKALTMYNKDTEFAHLKQKLRDARHWNANVGKQYLRIAPDIIHSLVNQIGKESPASRDLLVDIYQGAVSPVRRRTPARTSNKLSTSSQRSHRFTNYSATFPNNLSPRQVLLQKLMALYRFLAALLSEEEFEAQRLEQTVNFMETELKGLYESFHDNMRASA